MTFILLWTDACVFFLLLASIAFACWARQQAPLCSGFRHIMKTRQGIITGLILSVFLIIGLLDSVHFKTSLMQYDHQGQGHAVQQVYSVMDLLIAPLGQQYEKTYSAPFSTHLYSKSIITTADGRVIRDYLPLRYVRSTPLAIPLSLSIVLSGFVVLLLSLWHTAKSCANKSFRYRWWQVCCQQAWLYLSFYLIVLVVITLVLLAQHYHVLGTDKIGQDILYQCLKSIRTGLVIGTLTTLIMLPFAMMCGLFAGYFGGKVDDVIQYLYTTLSSIPGVLLIAAAVLALQVVMGQHPQWFGSMSERADARLLALCVILGVTSWTSLCRLLRGECLKLREKEYVQAAKVLGVKNFAILWRHLLPNVVHIILITVVLDFSGLVLAEAVLSYVGVGVDPATMSWGNMINSARLELAREPVVWWPLCGAFFFMFSLVLAANLFADVVRDAFDPRVKQQ